MARTLPIILTAILTVFISTYFHERNIVNQCNSKGYAELFYGVRLSCLEIE